MHDYAVFGHDRANIGRWLGVTSLLLAGGLAQVFTWLTAVTGWEAFSKAVVTTSALYFAFDWLFNKCAWKNNWFGIPNLNGIWTVDGRTLDEEGNVTHEWDAEIDIEQSWRQISIRLKTKDSQSVSYTGTISKRTGSRGGWLLSYSYKNEPELEQSLHLNSHKGYCEIEFDKELTKGKAAYFNSNGRRTFGVMNITKEALS